MMSKVISGQAQAARNYSLDKPFALDLVSSAFKADPFPAFARMRELGPVVPARFPLIGGIWVTTTYEATQAVLKRNDLFVMEGVKAGKKGTPGLQWWMPKSVKLLTNNMLQKDEPDHRRLRKLVDRAFARRGILDMRADVERLADKLLDDFEGKGEVDLLREYSRKLPLEVICDLLGLRLEDRAKFAAWADRLADVSVNPAGLFRAMSGIRKMTAYLREEIERVRADERPGLICELVKAEEDGDKLSESELLAMVFLLLVAGFETTTNLIAGAVVDLEQNPEQKAWLLEEPDERMERAVEELARHVSSVQGTKPRYVAQDTDFFGVKLKRGQTMMALVAAANADPAVFDAPDKLDLDRFPNPHLVFATGIHFCLGLQLARLETQVALTRLYARYPDLALVDPDKVDYSERPGSRGIKSLMIRTNQRVKVAA